MKNNLKKIELKLKKLISFKRMNPHIYWISLLYSFLIITVLLILFSFYLLIKIKNQQIFQITPDLKKQPIIMDDKLFEKVMKSFDNRLIKEKEIKDGLIIYKDPSSN